MVLRASSDLLSILELSEIFSSLFASIAPISFIAAGDTPFLSLLLLSFCWVGSGEGDFDFLSRLALF